MIKLKTIIKNKKNSIYDFALDTRNKNDRIVQEPSRLKRRLMIIGDLIKNLKSICGILFGKVVYVPYVEVVLTTYCTLRCKGCSALMDQYEDRTHIDAEKIIEYLQKFIDSVDVISYIRLLGGEPLCYPQLYEILSFLDKQDKVKKATVVTNGTLLFSDERIIDILKKDKFYVFISDYGKVSTKKDELVKQLSQNNIEYFVRNEDMPWHDMGNFVCRNRSENELKEQFYKCDIGCKSILNGKLFYCPRSSHGTNIKKVPLREQDYIDLTDEKMSRKQLRRKIYKFYYKYVPYTEACNYCDYKTSQEKPIKPGVQCEK